MDKFGLRRLQQFINDARSYSGTSACTTAMFVGKSWRLVEASSVVVIQGFELRDDSPLTYATQYSAMGVIAGRYVQQPGKVKSYPEYLAATFQPQLCLRLSLQRRDPFQRPECPLLCRTCLQTHARHRRANTAHVCRSTYQYFVHMRTITQ